MTIPFINPDVKYLGVSSLRGMTYDFLESLEHPVVIAHNGTELVVMLPWKTFVELQDASSPRRSR